MKNETKTKYYVRHIADRWEVWSSVEYVKETVWRKGPFHNWICECTDEVEAQKKVDKLNS